MAMEIYSDLFIAPEAAPEPETEPDITSVILSRYQSSPADHHQHLCATVGAIAQSLKDQNLPQTTTSFFAAAKSSLDRLTQNSNSDSDPVTTSLLLLLSIVVPRASVAVVKSTWDSVTGTVVRVLGFGTLPVSGVKGGLKCLAGLLKVGEKGSWEKVSPAFEGILGFITDSRPKVRKQSHSSLYDILQSFKGSPAIILASQGITNVFEGFLLLAGGSNSTMASAEGPRGAMEVLYILNALRDCLSLMSTKYTTTIMKYCKSLVDLRQPIVTRTIMEILQNFCSSSTSEVASEMLLDLLCSLALCVAEKENLADEMASTARLLHIGTKKVYHLNRKMCIVKLPLIFNALGDILASEHEEAIFAATEALKGLMSSCIDEGLVTHGIEQIKLNTNGGIRKSGPTIIEKICCTMEGLLGYRFNAVLDISFQVLSTAFYQLGRSSSTLLGKSVKSLANFQNLPDENFPFRKQLHECVGAAVGTIGPEMFLSLLPLNLDAEDISEANVWLLPILKQYTVGAHLKFFSQNILDIVRVVQQKSPKLAAEGRTFSARSTKGLVYQLWSLLPAFCNYPVDTSISFKDLQEVICTELRQESDLHGIMCFSLQILIRQNKSILEDNSTTLDDKLSDPERKAREHYTREVAEENLNAIRSFAYELLSALLCVLKKSAKDSGGCLQSTFREVASISDKILVKNFFKNVMTELLWVTEKASKGKQFETSGVMEVDEPSNEASLSHKQGLLLDLAVSLLPGADKEEIDLLFTAIKSPLQDKDGVVQKKAYKTLATMFKESGEFLSSKADELMSLMFEATNSCHFSAKRRRLDSLYYLIVSVSKDASDQRKRDIISAFLTEIILALKEANRKTRNRAYDLLVEMGHACGDEEQGGKKENLLNFFQMIAGGLAGEKPHMISAAVKGLARLAYEFPDLISALYHLLPSSFLLLQRKNHEIIKANLGLIKVLVAKSKAEGLQMHLKMMVEGLLKWQDGTKYHFKPKVKLLLEMLVRKCGIDAIRDVMPEEHMRLLTNIRKMKERKERKAKSEEETESLHTKTSISRQSRWNRTRIFSDFGDENMGDDSDAENGGAKAVIGRRTKASIPVSRASLRSLRKLHASESLPEDLLGQSEDEPLDLLDRQRTRARLQFSPHLKRKTQYEDEPELDSKGRLVIREDGSYLRRPRLPLDHNLDARSQTVSQFSAKSSTKSQKKRRKTSESGWTYTGNEYTNRKAGGDLKKDKVEPYAYWPLDRKLLNRRSERKASARKGMTNVMKFAKRFEGKSASRVLSARRMQLKKKAGGGQKKRD